MDIFITESDSYFAEHPYPTIECITNCERYLDSSAPLHLKANCETCSKIAAQFDILYLWEVNYPADSTKLYSSTNEDWKEHSYSNPNEFLPDLRLKTTAFRREGLHKITVTMAVRSRSADFTDLVASSFYYATMPKTQAQPSMCYINPPFGVAGATIFEVSCASVRENVVYEMFYSGCHACGNEKAFKLFHRGYSDVATGAVDDMIACEIKIKNCYRHISSQVYYCQLENPNSVIN